MIPPGKAGTVKTLVKTAGLRGELSKTIAVRTNDPLNSVFTLAVRAQLVGSVLLYPRQEFVIMLGRQKGPSRLVVRKDPTEPGELVVSDLEPSVPWLTTTARRVTTAQPAADGLPATEPGDWILEVSAEGGGPSRKPTVSFRTGLAREETVTIPVRLGGRRAIEVSTDRLVLEKPPSGGPSRKDFLATVRPGLDPTKLMAEASPAVFGARLEPAGARHFRVHVSWTPDGSGAETEGTLTLRIGEESVRIPLSVSGS